MTHGSPPASLPVTHQRPKPGTVWWVGGGVLVAAGAMIGVGLVVSVFVTMFRSDASVYADGRAYAATLEAHQDYLLWAWVDERAPLCTVVDEANGQPIEVHGMGSTSLTKNGREAIGWFDSGSGEVTVACPGSAQPPSTVEIGPRPHAPEWIGGLVGAILVPLLLVGAGVAVLVITGIRQVAAGRP